MYRLIGNRRRRPYMRRVFHDACDWLGGVKWSDSPAFMAHCSHGNPLESFPARHQSARSAVLRRRSLAKKFQKLSPEFIAESGFMSCGIATTALLFVAAHASDAQWIGDPWSACFVPLISNCGAR